MEEPCSQIKDFTFPAVNEKNYLSFLLRVWRVRQDDHFVWRASLEDTKTGERQGFANMEELLIFLREQVLEKREKPIDVICLSD